MNWMLDNRPIPDKLQTGIVIGIPSKESKKESKKVTFDEFKALQGFVVHN
ncbi:hypothetical protein [Bacillus mycoides]